MLIENKYAIELVELLKASKKINQKKTTVSFNEDGTRCSVHVSWKAKNKPDLYTADHATVTMLCILTAWTTGGAL